MRDAVENGKLLDLFGVSTELVDSNTQVDFLKNKLWFRIIEINKEIKECLHFLKFHEAEDGIRLVF
jgi:hypothetical protein